MVPLFKPATGDEEAKAVARVLKSGWLGKGPEVELFEHEFAQALCVPYAVSTNSCTAALILALKCNGVGGYREPGQPLDEVIVPTLTFCSTAHAVMAVGARPVFADVDPHTLCMDYESAHEAIAPATTAHIPVHFAGYPMPLFHTFYGDDCDNGQNVPHIEDCAHAFGAQRNGIKCGAAGTGCFSLHAVKHIACGDGGMLTTHDPEVRDRGRRLSWLGIDKSTHDRTRRTSYHPQYEINERGFKCHMNDITAAIGRVQLRRQPELLEARTNIATRYSAELSGVRPPPDAPPGCRHAWHLYVIRHPDRDRLREHLTRQGVTTGIHYRPLHTYPLYGQTDASCPNAMQAFSEILSLPMYPTMTEAEQSTVIQAVNSF